MSLGFEGFTVGAQRTSGTVWALATMLSAHKWILSLSLVSTMVQKEMKVGCSDGTNLTPKEQ